MFWLHCLPYFVSWQTQRECITSKLFEAWMGGRGGGRRKVTFRWVLMSRNLVERFGGKFRSGCLVLSESTGNFTFTALSTWCVTHRKGVFGNCLFHSGAWMLSWTLAGLSNLGLQIRTSVILRQVRTYYGSFWCPWGSAAGLWPWSMFEQGGRMYRRQLRNGCETRDQRSSLKIWACW